MTDFTKRLPYCIIVAAVGALPNFAYASQGPGTGPGTASASVQLAMALAVYGGAGLLVAAGLIGAARSRR